MFQVMNRANNQVYTVYKVEKDWFLIFDPLKNMFDWEDVEEFVIPNANTLVESSRMEINNSDSVFPKNALFSSTSVSRENLDDLLYQISHSVIPVHIGDSIAVRLLDNITDVEFVITDFDDDSIRFESRDCLNNRISATEIDEYLKAVWEALPDAFKDYIIDTERRYVDDSGSIQKTNCKLFLPAASEIFDGSVCYGDKGLYQQLDWYKDVHNRVRALQKDGDANTYWTNSRYEGNTTAWCGVYITGFASSHGIAYTHIGAPVCFRIRRVKA